MGINVDWTPSSAAPALYGAALGAGQEQFRNRRQQELMQLAELDQRQQALQANLYNQQQARALDAQQAAQDRAFRAQAMQFGAAQDIFQQQQHFLQQQELEQDNWFNQQEESGALIRDAASRMKLQKLHAQQGAIRSAQNLTAQDKQMKLMELQDQIRAERRGGLREPLPGERQKSMQEKWQESSIKVNGPNGEIMYVSPDRSGAFREVGRFEPPTTTASRQREVEPVITVRTIDPNTGKPVVTQAAKTFEEIQAERQIQEQIETMPTLTEIEELHKVPVGFPFKGPDGRFFERDDTPQGFHPIDDPRKVIYDSVQARATEMAADQARLLREAAERKKQEVAAQKAAERRQKHLDDIKQMTVKETVGSGPTTKEKQRPLTPDEMLEELKRREAFDRMLEDRLQPPVDQGPPLISGIENGVSGQRPTDLKNPPMPPVPQPTTQAEYDALPSGSLYRFTDGRIMRKP